MEEVHTSKGRMRVLSWLSYAGLGDEYRLNTPGVQTGQWDKRLPYTLRVEALLAAVRGQQSNKKALEVVGLIQRLTKAGLAVETEQTGSILNVTPEVGGGVVQIREVDDPFLIDAFIKGTPQKATLVVTDQEGNKQRIEMDQHEIDPASQKLGTDASTTKWTVAFASDEERAVYDFVVEVKTADGSVEISKKGHLVSLNKGADQNPSS